jgi:hypothetical protein
VDNRSLEDFAARVRGLRRTEQLDAAAREALDAFAAAGVDTILLKGVSLARFLYAGQKPRAYSDVDLLVAPPDVPAAREALSGLGYENMTAARGVEDIAGAVHAETWVRKDQQIGPLMVDLHTRLPGVEAPPVIAWQLLAARRVAIDLNGGEAWVLPREGLALHVAIHAAQHFPYDTRPLADLRYALERWPAEVWEGAKDLATALDAQASFAAGLRLVPEGARLAAALELPSSDQFEWEMRNRESRPRGTFHLQALLEARGLRARIGVLGRALWPKREWLVWEDRRAAAGGLRLARARVRHVLRTPGWALSALIYRRRARRAR